jgi:hypothetical protein
VSTIPLTTRNPEPRTIFLWASTDSSTTKPSRKRQLPRVINQSLAWWFPSATMIKTLMQCTRNSQSHKECNHQAKWVRERIERALQGSMDLSKCQESLSNPGLRVFILPLPFTSHYGQNVYLADCSRLNSNGKNAKSTAGRRGRWAPRTVRPVHRAAHRSVCSWGE